jgi:hypothetical protein
MFVFNMNIVYLIFIIGIFIKILTIESEKKSIHYFFDNYTSKNEIVSKKEILKNIDEFIYNYLQDKYKFIGSFHKDFQNLISKLFIISIYENINEKEEYRKVKNEVFIYNLFNYYSIIYERDFIIDEELNSSLIQNIIDELSSLNIEGIFSLYKSIFDIISTDQNNKFYFQDYLQKRNKICISYNRLQVNSSRLEKYTSYLKTKNSNYIHEI